VPLAAEAWSSMTRSGTTMIEPQRNARFARTLCGFVVASSSADAEEPRNTSAFFWSQADVQQDPPELEPTPGASPGFIRLLVAPIKLTPGGSQGLDPAVNSSDSLARLTALPPYRCPARPDEMLPSRTGSSFPFVIVSSTRASPNPPLPSAEQERIPGYAIANVSGFGREELVSES
jgi:hypothetical protein